MRAYLVSAGVGTIPRLAGSAADAKDKRDALIALHGVKKSQVSTGEIDVPTNKADLLPFINDLLAGLEPKE